MAGLRAAILLVTALLVQDARSATPGSQDTTIDCSGGATACTTTTQSTCVANDKCQCNVHYEADTSGSAPVCTALSCSVKADCRDNAWCSGSTCDCVANYNEVTTTCAQIDCTTANFGTVCAADSYCATNKCTCKANFESISGTCTRKTCTTSDITNCVTNSHCSAATNGDCTCGLIYSEAETTCEPKSCTQATVLTACGASTYCDDKTLKCSCAALFEGSGTSCVADACTNDGDCVTANAVCTGGACACKTDYTADGAFCKKTCTANTDCGTDAVCFNSKCECPVNYAGTDPGATCTAISGCSANTECHSNSVCNTGTGSCSCATGWTAVGTVCKKTCAAATVADDCGSKSVCTDGKCECEVNYAGDGVVCAQKACNAVSDCAENSACTDNLCECNTNYVGGNTTCTVVPTTTNATVTVTTSSGTRGLLCNFSLLAFAFVALQLVK